MHRMMIFIDAEYVIQSLRHLRNQKGRVPLENINWHRLVSWIQRDRELIRCYYYTAELSRRENEDTYNRQREILKSLKSSIEYLQIRLGKLVRQKGTWVQKGIDVKIAVDMVSKAFLNHYDVAALVSGDADFLPLVEEIKEAYGKQVELYTFDRYDSTLDEDFSFTPDRYINIDAETAIQNEFFAA
ncbi:MAG: NYN domain-containing protein [Anaerolineae bacterium]